MRCTQHRFIGEDEKLFLGGFEEFSFSTIRNMATTPKENYSLYIQSMTMFHFMIECFLIRHTPITKLHALALKLLVREELAGKGTSSQISSVVPRYILELWHNFLCSEKFGSYVEIDWYTMQGMKGGAFGLFSEVFCLSGKSGLDFCSFLRIFPNLKSLLLSSYVGEYALTVPLNEAFLANTLSALDLVNSTPSLTASFRMISVALPKGDIDAFVAKYNFAFKERGWTLNQKPYKTYFHAGIPEEPNSLCVERM